MDQDEPRETESGRFLPRNQAAVKHGGHGFLTTGKVPSVRGARALKRELCRIRKELVAVTSDLNVKKELLIDQVISAQGFMKLFEMYCQKAGILNAQKWKKRILEFQPAFQTYLSLMNAQRNALAALGLENKEPEKVLDIRAYAREKYGHKMEEQ